MGVFWCSLYSSVLERLGTVLRFSSSVLKLRDVAPFSICSSSSFISIPCAKLFCILML